MANSGQAQEPLDERRRQQIVWQKNLARTFRSAKSTISVLFPALVLLLLDFYVLRGFFLRKVGTLLLGTVVSSAACVKIIIVIERLTWYLLCGLFVTSLVVLAVVQVYGMIGEVEITKKLAAWLGVPSSEFGFKFVDSPAGPTKSPSLSPVQSSPQPGTPSKLSWMFDLKSPDYDLDTSGRSPYSPSQSWSLDRSSGGSSLLRGFSVDPDYPSPTSTPRTIEDMSAYSPGQSFGLSGSSEYDKSYGSFYNSHYYDTSFSSSISAQSPTRYGQNATSDEKLFTDVPPAQYLDRLRRARSMSPFCESKLMGINNEEQLTQFLDDYNQKHSRTSSMLGHGTTMFDEGLMNRSLDLGVIQSLRYRMSVPAEKAPQLPKVDVATGTMQSYKELSLSALYARLTVDNEQQMETFMRNIRFWLSKNVVKPVVADIQRANTEILQLGRSDLLIGVADPLTLTQMFGSKTNAQQTHPLLASRIDNIAPYLTLCSDQKFLLSKLQDWAKDTYLGSYNWCSDSTGSKTGGGKDASETSDANLLMRVFLTYMDSVLPPHPLYTYTKVFTSEYFTQEKSLLGTGAAATRVRSAASGLGGFHRAGRTVGPPIKIWQSSASPPHYELILERFGEVGDPGKGRMNLFRTVALFFRFFVVHNREHIEAVSLGSSGLDVTSVFTKTGFSF